MTFRTTTTWTSWLIAVSTLSAACGSSGVGGGGAAIGATGGVAGSPCNATVQNQGCLATTTPPKRMQCVNNVWTELGACGANETCAEQADPAAAGTAKRIAVCVAKSGGGGTDASSGDTLSDGSTLGDAAAADGATGGDVLVVDILQSDVAKTDTSKPDVCTPKCAAKQCGPNGCGGSCGTCAGNTTCNAAGQCEASGALLGEGQSCLGGVGACDTGLQCQATSDLTDWTCQPEKQANQSCGPGLGECATGLLCNFTSVAKTASKCYAPGGSGATCYYPGGGTCVAGYECIYSDAQGTGTKCAPTVGPGDACDVVGIGLCGPGYDCTPNAGSTAFECAPVAPAGSACGAGIGGCEAGSSCIFDSSSQTSATCIAYGHDGDECGTYGTPGDCVAWFACTPDDSSTTSTSHCRPTAALNGACGYNIGLCAPYLACSYADSTQTDLVCLKAGANGAVCGPGVGGCLPGYACYLAQTGDTTGTCKDDCTTGGKYSDGTCDACLKPDPDCLK